MTNAKVPARFALQVELLTPEAFAPFGQVIAADAQAPHHTINEGFAERFPDVARPDTFSNGGRVRVDIYRARPRALPLKLQLVERHKLGSQLFMPLSPQRFLVVVAPPGPPPQREALRGFLATPGQGINLAPGTWHHPLLALDAGGDFLVIDRADPTGAEDCEIHRLDQDDIWILNATS